MPSRKLVVLGTLAVLLVFSAMPSLAQTASQTGPDRGQLVVTVTDQSGGVLVGASVALVGLDDLTKRAVVQPLKTAEKGVAAFADVTVGRYRVQAEYPAFESGQRELQVRRGENRLTIVLTVKSMAEAVTVGREPATVVPGGGYYLTREAIAALSDNPNDMYVELMNMIGGRDNIFIDGFRGGTLPSKAQIQSIHVIRDAFSAENHAPGGRVDVVTKVGEGPVSGGVNYAGEDLSLVGNGSLNFQGRDLVAGQPRQLTPFGAFTTKGVSASPFAPSAAGMGDQWGGAFLRGTIAAKKSSFSLNAYHERSYNQPLIYAQTPAGLRAEVSGFQEKYDEDNASAMIDLALGRNHSMRGQYYYWYSLNTFGVGGYDLSERGWSYKDTSHTARLLETGPFGTRGFMNTRLSVEWEQENNRPDLEAQTIRVLDAFTSGGAQQGGGLRSRQIMLASDVDYVRGMHAVRGGLALDHWSQESSWTSNYLGTYTFESLAAHDAGQPRSFTQVVGDPRIDYTFVRAGLYIQDDIRVRKNLVFSPGLRYEAQMHVPDWANWAPRFGVTWSPGKAGQTAIRASVGVFYDWMAVDVLEQTLRLDGQHQTEINIANPAYPIQAPVGPANRYQLSDDLRLPQLTRLAVAVSKRVGANVRVDTTYTQTRGADRYRGANLNPIANGVRPNPALANVIEVVSDARSSGHQLDTSVLVNFAGAPGAGIARGGQAGGGGAAGGRGRATKVDWHRQSLTIGYTYNSQMTDTEGPFAVPATGNLADEWGPATPPNPDNTDLRHSGRLNYNNTVLRNLTVGLIVNRSLGVAYTHYTGLDTNGDLIFNDRPDGVGRNSLRGAARLTFNFNLRYAIARGTQGDRPYTVELFTQANNLGNRYNYAGYSGVMTSPFYLQPTAVVNPMVIRAGLNIGF